MPLDKIKKQNALNSPTPDKKNEYEEVNMDKDEKTYYPECNKPGTFQDKCVKLRKKLEKKYHRISDMKVGESIIL